MATSPVWIKSPEMDDIEATGPSLQEPPPTLEHSCNSAQKASLRTENRWASPEMKTMAGVTTLPALLARPISNERLVPSEAAGTSNQRLPFI